MSGFLPVTPTIHPAKPENAVSQQLLGRFRSSFEELKPYPYAPRLSFPTIPNFIFFVLKLPTFFRELPLLNLNLIIYNNNNTKQGRTQNKSKKKIENYDLVIDVYIYKLKTKLSGSGSTLITFIVIVFVFLALTPKSASQY